MTECVFETERTYRDVLQRQYEGALFALQSYEAYLARRYTLAEGERIREDGTIQRVPEPAP